MNVDEVNALIQKEQSAVDAYNDQIQTAKDRGQTDEIPGLEATKQEHANELTRLQTTVMQEAQAKAAEEKAKEAAEKAKEEEEKDDGLTLTKLL